jgi:hypothetical protein
LALEATCEVMLLRENNLNKAFLRLQHSLIPRNGRKALRKVRTK